MGTPPETQQTTTDGLNLPGFSTRRISNSEPPSRDGVKVYSLAEVDRERRTGQPWYGGWPAKLLDREYPQWRKGVAGRKAQ